MHTCKIPSLQDWQFTRIHLNNATAHKDSKIILFHVLSLNFLSSINPFICIFFLLSEGLLIYCTINGKAIGQNKQLSETV